MSLNYRLVRRPDMRKDAAEGSKPVSYTHLTLPTTSIV